MSNPAETTGKPVAQRRLTGSKAGHILALFRLRARLVGATLAVWEPLLWASIVVLAVMILVTRFEIGQNADGLLQTVMSLQHLTLFFWEQNRFANLLPLLASGIADPTANAEVQLAMRVGLGIAAPLLFCAPIVHAGRSRDAGRSTLLATSLALAFAPHRILHEWFIEASPYGTSFALAGFALLLFGAARARGGRAGTALRSLGLLVTIAAYLVNASLALFAGPLFAMLAVTRSSAVAVEFGIASIIGGIVTWSAASAVDSAPTSMRFGETLIGLNHYLGQFYGKPGLFLAGMSGLFALSAVIGNKIKLPKFGCSFSYGIILVFTFIIGFLAIALSSWVIANGLHPRYLVPLYILAASLGAISCLTVLDGVAARSAFRSRATLGLCAALLLMACQRSLPAPPRDNEIVDGSVAAAAGAAASVVTRLKLDGLVGDYWTVWPAVFLAEQQAHEFGRLPGSIFGISYRGSARRLALQARLLTQGSLDLACLDLRDEQCEAVVNDVVGLTSTITRTLQPPRPLGRGHTISAVRLTISTNDAPHG